LPPRRRSAAGVVTIGFYGTGEIERVAASHLIEDYIAEHAKDSDSTDSIRFLLPVSSNEWTDSLADVIDMAEVGRIPYEIFMSPSDRGAKSLGDVISSAARVHRVEDPLVKLRSTLNEAPGAALFVLWDNGRTEAMEVALGPFLDDGIKAFELTDGLAEMDFRAETVPGEEPEPGEDEEGEEPAEEAEEAEEEGLYTRDELSVLPLADLKAIGAQLGVPPKRATALMIDAILEAQGEPEEEPEEDQPEEDEPEEDEPEEAPVALESLIAANGEFLDGLRQVFNAFLADFKDSLEGVRFNGLAVVPETPSEAPEEPAAAPRPRRLGSTAKKAQRPAPGRRGRLHTGPRSA
jgi:hypothetical protein